MAEVFGVLHRKSRAVARAGAAVVRRGLLTLAVLSVAALWARTALAGHLVSMNTNHGTILIDLFTDVAPVGAANFLSYVNSGAYNGTMVHRADPGLNIIQGGGFTWNNGLVAIPKSDPIAHNYVLPNTRGTISYARGGTLDSATSEWFINAQDNSTNLGPANNGGYAVFGWVVGGDMAVVDAIMDLSKADVGGFPFNNVPYTPPLPLTNNNLVINTTVTDLGAHPSYQNPFLDVDINNDGLLKTNDALASINDILANGPRQLTAPFSATNYLDANGSGSVTTSDTLRVINAILEQQALVLTSPLTAGAPQFDVMAAPASEPALLVPEPSSLALCAAAAALLAAGTLLRGRRRRASPR